MGRGRAFVALVIASTSRSTRHGHGHARSKRGSGACEIFGGETIDRPGPAVSGAGRNNWRSGARAVVEEWFGRRAIPMPLTCGVHRSVAERARWKDGPRVKKEWAAYRETTSWAD
jgi:hypothetical protein